MLIVLIEWGITVFIIRNVDFGFQRRLTFRIFFLMKAGVCVIQIENSKMIFIIILEEIYNSIYILKCQIQCIQYFLL